MNTTAALLWLYVAAVFAATLALMFSRWAWWAKAGLVAAALGLWVAASGALDDVWGRPSRDALPERFVLLAAVFDEPRDAFPGALYVWVNEIVDGAPAPEPRAYRLPYSKDLHAMLNEAMKKVRQGVSQMGTAEPKRGPKGYSWLRPGHDEQDVKIRDLPVPQLPEK